MAFMNILKKTTELYIFKWITLNFKKKKQNVDTCYNIDEPWKHWANWKKQPQKTTQYTIPLVHDVQNRLIYRQKVD